MLSSSAKLLHAARRAVGFSSHGGDVLCKTATTSFRNAAHNNNTLQAAGLSTAVRPATATESYEEVTFVRLNNLQDNPGAVKKGRRVGRGIGSSKGKTCGKGHKGQRARNRSSIPAGFEGGQTKFYKLLPKKGFSNKRHREKRGADMAVLNLGTIQDYIDMGRLKADNISSSESAATATTSSFMTLGIVDFINAGMFKKSPSLPGVKLLAKGKERFTAPVRLVVNRASQGAIAHAAKVGGQVTTAHYNRLAMRALIRPDKFSKLAVGGGSSDGEDNEEEEKYLLPKQARPPPKLQPYYTSWKNRGYLCPQVQMKEWLQSRPEMEEAFGKALKVEEEKKGGKEITDES